MAISKLSDIIPVTTMIENEGIVPAPLVRARRKKKAARRKKAPAKRTISQSAKGPWSMKNYIWEEKFEQFLEFCGWKRDQRSEFPECLKHPKDDLWFTDGDFVDNTYNTLIDAMVNKDKAKLWYADDVLFILYKEIKLANKAVCRVEIKLK